MNSKQKPSGQHTTKEQEIEALHKFAAAQPEGSYLHTLFSRAFLIWVEQRIQDDVMPDIIGQLDYEIDRTNANGKAAEALRLEVERLNRIVKNYEANSAQINETITDLRKKYETAHKALAELTEQFNERRAEHAAEINEWREDYDACKKCLDQAETALQRQQEDNRQLRIEVEFQANQIVKLKALLWDMNQELELATK